jgi:acetylornithine aminotransferase
MAHMSWLKDHRGETVVVKLGGSTMVDEALALAFAEDVVALQRAGLRVVVTHGGGPQISAELLARGIPSEFRDGLRVTTREAALVVRAVLATIGTELADSLVVAGGSALALGGEGEPILAARRIGGDSTGEPTEVDAGAILEALEAGTIPVVSAIGVEAGTGELLNINADAAAGALAVAVRADRLLLLTDVAGLYRDWPDRDSLVRTIGAEELAGLLPSLESGMIPKMAACLAAVEDGVASASIVDGRVPHVLVAEPFGASGTTVVPTSRRSSSGSRSAPRIETTSPWLARYRATMMGTVTSPLALLVRGEGCHVWDADGNRYLDFLAGIAVNALGHAHPALVNAVSSQIATLAHVSNYFATPPQLELSERLRRLTGAGEDGRVFFGNSGAEAVEAAFKLARRNRTGGARPRILSLRHSFHGRTMGALSLTGQPTLQEPFAPLVPGVEHLEATIDALEAAMGPDVAALVLEPIQGEAGVVDLPEGYLERARELTERHGALLILDEIQTGIGRTGTWFAFQQFGIVPDAVTLAKGIAGGVPIGALVTFGAASTLLEAGHHGSTFGGNPLAAAAGNAVLGEIESAGLVENAARRGTELRSMISGLAHPLIAEVRGRGLLIGLGLTAPLAKELAAAALARGLIVNAPHEDSIRIAPPLIVGDPELSEFRTLFTEALESLEVPA